MIIEARRPSKCVNADEIVNRQNNPLNKWVLQPNISFTFPKSAKIGKNKIVIKKFMDCETPTNAAHINGKPKRNENQNVHNQPNELHVISPHIVVNNPKKNGTWKTIINIKNGINKNKIVSPQPLSNLNILKNVLINRLPII